MYLISQTLADAGYIVCDSIIGIRARDACGSVDLHVGASYDLQGYGRCQLVALLGEADDSLPVLPRIAAFSHDHGEVCYDLEDGLALVEIEPAQ
jgi:hypothetical protein